MALPHELLGYHHKFDGRPKFYTKNCPSCQWHVNEEKCYWGLAWKRLVPRENPRKCELQGNPSPRYERHKRSLELDKIVNETKKSAGLDPQILSSYMDPIGRWEKSSA